jgi:hypothetical protein
VKLIVAGQVFAHYLTDLGHGVEIVGNPILVNANAIPVAVSPDAYVRGYLDDARRYGELRSESQSTRAHVPAIPYAIEPSIVAVLRRRRAGSGRTREGGGHALVAED